MRACAAVSHCNFLVVLATDMNIKYVCKYICHTKFRQADVKIRIYNNKYDRENEQHHHAETSEHMQYADFPTKQLEAANIPRRHSWPLNYTFNIKFTLTLACLAIIVTLNTKVIAQLDVLYMFLYNTGVGDGDGETRFSHLPHS